MAIWQVSLELITDTTLSFSEPTFSESVQKLAEVFPEEKSWCAFIKQYGNIDSTCIEISLKDSVVENISLRLGLLNLSRQDLHSLCEFAIANNMYIKYRNTLYPPQVDSFKKIVIQSEAHKFLSNPHKYLDSINNELKESDSSV